MGRAAPDPVLEGPERSPIERTMQTTMQESRLRAWCPGCRQHVGLTNLRSWPEGVLVIGDCPSCHASVAASRPVGWNGNGNGAHVAGAGRAE
jgi:hypothetical protein